MKFSTEIDAALAAPLLRENVKTRSQSGRSLSYIEGWKAISEANRIFGFAGWTRETLDLKMVAEAERSIGQSGAKGWGVTYTARVRVTVFCVDGLADIIRDGCGTGHGIDRDRGLAHESALKEAETDAMKRAFMTFGNPFGLALYDKTQADVADEMPGETWPLLIPGNPDPYQTFGSAGAWVEGVNDLALRILESTKYSQAEKDAKLIALAASNRPVYDKLPESNKAGVTLKF